MKNSFVAILFVLSAVSFVDMHNTPPKPVKQPEVAIVEVQEVVKPVKVHVEHVKPVKPVVKPVTVGVSVDKNAIHRAWPLLCFVPKAWLIKPSLKLDCPKLAIKATGHLVKKAIANSGVVVTVGGKPVAIEHVALTRPQVAHHAHHATATVVV